MSEKRKSGAEMSFGSRKSLTLFLCAGVLTHAGWLRFNPLLFADSRLQRREKLLFPAETRNNYHSPQSEVCFVVSNAERTVKRWNY